MLQRGQTFTLFSHAELPEQRDEAVLERGLTLGRHDVQQDEF